MKISMAQKCLNRVNSARQDRVLLGCVEMAYAVDKFVLDFFFKNIKDTKDNRVEIWDGDFYTHGLTYFFKDGSRLSFVFDNPRAYEYSAAVFNPEGK
jgi:hypothetical protein